LEAVELQPSELRIAGTFLGFLSLAVDNTSTITVATLAAQV
jgi:hypothetical protein